MKVLPLGKAVSMVFTATMPPADWKSASAPATSPAFDLNSSNAAFVQILGESICVVAVMFSDKLNDSFFSVTATGFDPVEAPEISTGDAGPFSVFVGCEFSMMHTFLTVEFDPFFFEFFLTATM